MSHPMSMGRIAYDVASVYVLGVVNVIKLLSVEFSALTVNPLICMPYAMNTIHAGIRDD
jgi:hypothetical protein